jgi:hypothetical protein
MKVSDIHVGGIYHDGKLGVREVTIIGGVPLRVTYSLLAAKVEQEYSNAEKAVVSLIGSTRACDLGSFASWAKTAVPQAQKTALLAILAAKKLRLSPGETVFMDSVAASFDDETPAKAGTTVSLDFTETRAARGIEKKGLATVSLAQTGAGGEIMLTELGSAWVHVKRGELPAAAN